MSSEDTTHIRYKRCSEHFYTELASEHCRECFERDAALYKPRALKPPPVPMPQVQTTPDVSALLDTATHLIQQGLVELQKKGGQFSVNDVKALEGLVRALKVTRDVQRDEDPELRKQLEELAKEGGEEALREIAAKGGGK